MIRGLLALLILAGCATPARPVTVIVRNHYYKVIEPSEPPEMCGEVTECWYEPPTDLDYGPI